MKIAIIIACFLTVMAVTPEKSSAETVSRCDELKIQSEDTRIFKELLEKLRKDPFSDAFGVYIRDLEKLDRSLQELVDKYNVFLAAKCRPHNADVDEHDRQAAVWASSHCVVGPITKEESPACNARSAEFKTWESDIQNRLTNLTAEYNQIDNQWQDLNARAANPLLNAQNVLNPDNTEQALRLYTWFILKQKQSGSINSCNAFARIAEALGKRVANQDLFIEYLTRGFVELGGVDGRLIHIIVGDPPFRPAAGSTFDETGFKRKFYGPVKENQVRHAASYLAIGYKLRGGTSAVISFSQDVARRHPEMWDYYLAVSAGQLGFRLKHGTYNTTNFADAMRGEFCE